MYKLKKSLFLLFLTFASLLVGNALLGPANAALPPAGAVVWQASSETVYLPSLLAMAASE